MTQTVEEKNKDFITFISMLLVAILPLTGAIMFLGSLKEFGFFNIALWVVVSGVSSVLIYFVSKGFLGNFWGSAFLICFILFLAFLAVTDQAGSLIETVVCVAIGADLVWIMVFYHFSSDEDDEGNDEEEGNG